MLSTRALAMLGLTLADLSRVATGNDAALRDAEFLRALTSAPHGDVVRFFARECDKIEDKSRRMTLCSVGASMCGGLIARLAKVEHLRQLDPRRFQRDWDACLVSGAASPALVAFGNNAVGIMTAKVRESREAMALSAYSEYSDYSSEASDTTSESSGGAA